MLQYSTYLGGSSDEEGYGIATDGAGKAFVTGYTASANFPTQGQYQTDQPSSDAFVTVLDTTASGAASLLYSTYLGGSSDEVGWGIATDGAGKAFVTGNTYSANFPTQGQYQTDQVGNDAFVTVLDTTATGVASLLYSTYLGGNSYDFGDAIATDGAGNAFVTGYTDSTNFPTQGQYQTDQSGEDVFVTILNTTATGAASLLYSTYLGGSSHDFARGIATDGAGKALVIGGTGSTDFPTQGHYQPDQPSSDAFVTVLDTTATGAASLLYSTYLGGSDVDTATDIATDGAGKAFVSGSTGSTDFPTQGQYQTDQDQSTTDAFVTVLDPTATGAASLLYSTYLGGSSYDFGRGIATDGAGNAFVTGGTDSADFPTQGQYQTDQVGRDAFVTVLDTTATGVASLLYSTYLGGNSEDFAYDIAADGAGKAFVTGYTVSTNFPTQGQYQTDQGNNDAFVTVLEPEPPSTDPSDLTAAAVSSTKINLAWVDNSGSEDGFKIERKTGSGSFGQIVTVGPNVTTYSNGFLMPNTEYTYQVRAYQGSTNSGYAVSSPVTTPPLPADPTNLTATPVTSTRINLTWTDNATDETGYKIEKKTGAGGSFSQITTAAANATSYANIFLTPDTEYTYRVRAYRGTDNSGYATSTPVTTPALPAVPTNLTATVASSTRIDLAWTDNSGDETGFFVERKVASAGFFLINKVGANVTTYASISLIPNTQYTYRVRAYRGPDNSAYATSTPVTTLPLPAAPTNVTATVFSRTRVDLTWTDNATGETGYKIEKKTGTGAFTHIVSVGANVTSYSNSFLTPNTQYAYRVRAYRGADHSAYGTSNAVRTLP